jgi:hypothetical protein
MGTLFYGSQAIAVRIDDVLLRHLEIVITSKLRRGEGLTLTWHDHSTGDGRSTVWINSSTDLHYRYNGSREPHLDRDLLEELSVSAASNGGIRLTASGLAAMPPLPKPQRRLPPTDDEDAQARPVPA